VGVVVVLVFPACVVPRPGRAIRMVMMLMRVVHVRLRSPLPLRSIHNAVTAPV
jgi:hypothetical protein